MLFCLFLYDVVFAPLNRALTEWYYPNESLQQWIYFLILCVVGSLGISSHDFKVLGLGIGRYYGQVP